MSTVTTKRKPLLFVPAAITIILFFIQGVAVQGYANTMWFYVVSFTVGTLINVFVIWFMVNVFRRLFSTGVAAHKALKSTKQKVS